MLISLLLIPVLIAWMVIGVSIYLKITDVLETARYLSLGKLCIFFLLGLIPILNIVFSLYWITVIINEKVTFNFRKVKYDIEERRFVYLEEDDHS